MSLLQTVKLFGRVLSLFLPVRIIPRELEVRHIRSPLRNPRRPVPEIWSVVSCDRDRKKIWILHGPSARIFGSVVFPVCKSANPSDSCYCEIQCLDEKVISEPLGSFSSLLLVLFQLPSGVCSLVESHGSRRNTKRILRYKQAAAMSGHR